MPRSSTGHLRDSVCPMGISGIPCRLGLPDPIGRSSATEGVCFIFSSNRFFSFMRASTIRLNLSDCSMIMKLPIMFGENKKHPEADVQPFAQERVAYLRSEACHGLERSRRGNRDTPIVSLLYQDLY